MGSDFLHENNFVEVIELGDGEHLDVLQVHLDSIPASSEIETIEQKDNGETEVVSDTPESTSVEVMQIENEPIIEHSSISITLPTSDKHDEQNDELVKCSAQNDSVLPKQQSPEDFSVENVVDTGEEFGVQADQRLEI